MTGLIYVILISLWGVVLVPRWLRHHDESKRRRDTERLARVLNPHGQPDHASDEADSGTEGVDYQNWRDYLRSLASRETLHTAASAQWVETLRAPRGRHARRRRTIVFALTGLAVVSLLGAVVGVVPALAAVASIMLLSGYVTVMFLQMRQWESRQYSAAPEQAENGRYEADQRSTVAPARDGVRLVPGATAAGASTWEPQQSPAPIYATKAKASKVPRRIDLTQQGWTGADMVRQAREQQSPALQQQFEREFAAVEPDEEQQIDELANYRSYRRAVNE